MFRRLTDFGYQRTPVQAIGFYLVYLVVGIVVSAALSAVIVPFTNSSGFEEGFSVGAKVGTVFAVLLSIALSFSVLRAKGLLRHLGFLLVAVLSVAGATVGGLLLGLVFVAFLTTRPADPSVDTVDAEARPVEAATAR